jgi:hypothetical protein
MIARIWFNIPQPRKKLQLQKRWGGVTVTISLPKGHTMEKFICCKYRQYFISLWYYKFAILNYTDNPIKTMYAAISAIIFAAHGELLHLLHSMWIGSHRLLRHICDLLNIINVSQAVIKWLEHSAVTKAAHVIFLMWFKLQEMIPG